MNDQETNCDKKIGSSLSSNLNHDLYIQVQCSLSTSYGKIIDKGGLSISRQLAL